METLAFQGRKRALRNHSVIAKIKANRDRKAAARAKQSEKANTMKAAMEKGVSG